MKKSKFLKKSLAMLLALMLVVAMIPLSASAALPEDLKLIYVDGNTVKKLEVAEEIIPERHTEPIQKEKAKTANKKAKVERLQGMDLFSILFLCVALIFAGAS